MRYGCTFLKHLFILRKAFDYILPGKVHQAIAYLHSITQTSDPQAHFLVTRAPIESMGISWSLIQYSSLRQMGPSVFSLAPYVVAKTLFLLCVCVCACEVKVFYPLSLGLHS